MSDKCLYYEAAKKARDTGVRDDAGLEGSLGYERIGCFDCLGDNNRCLMYSVAHQRRSIIDNLIHDKNLAEHLNFTGGDGI